MEPMSDVERDENCDTPNIELSTTKASGQDDNEEYFSTSDTESEECRDTSVTKSSTKTSDHDNKDDLSEYEKLRLKNIAERKAKFKELKIKDKVLDLSMNNKIRKTKVMKGNDEDWYPSNKKPKATKRPFPVRKSKSRRVKTKMTKENCDTSSTKPTAAKRTYLAWKSREAKSRAIKIKKAENGRFNCDQCSKTYAYQKDLEQHIKIKHEGLSFDCDLCNKSYGTLWALRNHVSEKHHVTQSFGCHLCHRVCASQTALDFHLTCTHYLDENVV